MENVQPKYRLIQGSVRPMVKHNDVKFIVVLGRKVVDSVYFDAEMTPEQVRQTLLDRDGMSPEIKVFRA